MARPGRVRRPRPTAGLAAPPEAAHRGRARASTPGHQEATASGAPIVAASLGQRVGKRRDRGRSPRPAEGPLKFASAGHCRALGRGRASAPACRPARAAVRRRGREGDAATVDLTRGHSSSPCPRPKRGSACARVHDRRLARGRREARAERRSSARFEQPSLGRIPPGRRTAGADARGRAKGGLGGRTFAGANCAGSGQNARTGGTSVLASNAAGLSRPRRPARGLRGGRAAKGRAALRLPQEWALSRSPAAVPPLLVPPPSQPRLPAKRFEASDALSCANLFASPMKAPATDRAGLASAFRGPAQVPQRSHDNPPSGRPGAAQHCA